MQNQQQNPQFVMTGSQMQPQYNNQQRISGPGVFNYGGNYNSGNYDNSSYPEQRVTYADNIQARSQVGKDYNDKRFAGYNRKSRDEVDYKYNIYSIMDQPWNRYCTAGKCGNFPGNQGIAKDHTVQRW